MMQEKKAELSTYTCGFAFLLGGMIGCLTGFLCSEAALSNLTAFFQSQHTVDASGTCFAAELLIAVFALLLSLAAFGVVVIPLLDSMVGYCLGLYSFAAAAAGISMPLRFIPLYAFVPDVLILLRITARCSGISLMINRSWCGSGIRTFDLRSRLHFIWIELLLLWILYALRRIVFNP